jgi:hypothetical protein
MKRQNNGIYVIMRDYFRKKFERLLRKNFANPHYMLNNLKPNRNRNESI